MLFSSCLLTKLQWDIHVEPLTLDHWTKWHESIFATVATSMSLGVRIQTTKWMCKVSVYLMKSVCVSCKIDFASKDLSDGRV